LRTLGGFGLTYYPKYQRPKHIKFLENIAEKLTYENNQRFIIEMPPRHGKSVIFSTLLPAFYLINHPYNKVLLSSYSFSLAADFAYKVRNILQNYGLMEFPKNELANFENREGGGLFAAGVRGSITGKGANLLILDDPVKNMEEARSVLIRDKVYEWFKSTFLTRAEPGANIVIIQTRWNQDDLAGRLLREESEIWKEIKIPALAEKNDILGRQEGEPLWAERYSLEMLKARKESVGSFVWSAEFQQAPLNPEGALFRREWFEIVEDYPRDCSKTRYWDLAGTTAKESDYTAGVLLGEKDGIFYVIDVKRMKGTPLEVENLIRQTAMLDGNIPIYIEQEPGASGVQAIDHYRREVLKGFDFHEDKKSTNKELRARPVSACAEAGNLKIVKSFWNKDFLDEIEMFPNGLHDDQVDALSGAFEKISFGSVVAV